MQFEFLKEPPTEPRADSIGVGDKTVAVIYVRNLRAGRYVLRLRVDGTVRVTIPQRGSVRGGREFLERNVPWVRRQLHRLADRPLARLAWALGSEVLFRGEKVRIEAGVDSGSIRFAGLTLRVADCHENLRPVIEQAMRRLASVEFPARVMQLAREHGLAIRRIFVRDQKTRWGSCSPKGTISLNWRLIQMPQFVADYIFLHELMHLREMNHSRRFWRQVQSVCPDYMHAERWLTQHASLLR